MCELGGLCELTMGIENWKIIVSILGTGITLWASLYLVQKWEEKELGLDEEEEDDR